MSKSSLSPFLYTAKRFEHLVVAIDINIAIMRTFTKLREFSKHYNALAKQLIEIDRKHNKQYKELKKALDILIAESEVSDIKKIGFLKE